MTGPERYEGATRVRGHVVPAVFGARVLSHPQPAPFDREPQPGAGALTLAGLSDGDGHLLDLADIDYGNAWCTFRQNWRVRVTDDGTQRLEYAGQVLT